METYSYMLLLLLVTISTLSGVFSSGQVSVKLQSFVNPGGKGNNGHCCDGRSIFCFSACDHRFLLCLDDRWGSSSIGICPYGRVQTGVIHDANSIVFYGSIGGTRNPIEMKFNKWPGAMKLKVYVEDHDDNSNDYVDFLQTVISLAPAKSENTAITNTYYLRRRVRLTVAVKVFCDPDYYGRRCDVYCKPRDDHSGHYTCNTNTGAKICKPGWTGTFCSSSHDDCIGNQCKNGAACMDSHQSYLCICKDGFTGTYCENDINECTESAPCTNNGTCINSFGGYSCNCTFAWTGMNCQEAVDFCESGPCYHGSECQSTSTGFQCTCSTGWSGSQCEDNVDECLEEPCLYNGTCVDNEGGYMCQCVNGTTGRTCEVNIDDCASGPCFHSNATCYDLINGYNCSCPPGITGNNCTSGVFDIQIPGTLDKSKEDVIRYRLQEIIDESTVEENDNIHIEATFGSYTSIEGDNSTIVSLRAFYKDQQLDQAFLQKIYTPDKLTKLKEMGAYKSANLLQRADDKREHESWVVSNWYILLIVILVVVGLTTLSLIVFIKYKRKRKATKTAMINYWTNTQNGPSIGFENVVYSVEHQPTTNPDISLTNNVSAEMVDFMCDSDTINSRETMRSFRNNCSNS